MKGYIDLFVLPVPKKNLQAYCKVSNRYGRILKEYGALEYREFAGDGIKTKGMAALQGRIRLKPGEVLVSSVIGFRSKIHRDMAYKRAHEDIRSKRIMAEMEKNPPADMKRMFQGGFSTIVMV